MLTRSWLGVEVIRSLRNIMVYAFRPPFAAALLMAGFFYALPLHALESPWVEASHAEARILADTADGKRVRAGIEIRLQQGWKTYWRYPGDSGVPPRFDWSGSENLASAEIKWPAPERLIEDSGSKSIGYRDRVVFPLAIVPADPARPVKLKLKLDFAVCEKLCVPAEAKLSFDLPPEPIGRSEVLEQAEARVPRRVSLGEVGTLAVTKVDIERGPIPRAIIEITAPPAEDVQLFAEGPNEKWALPLPEKIEPRNGKKRFSLDFEGAPPGAGPIPPKLMLTLATGTGAIEVEVPLK